MTDFFDDGDPARTRTPNLVLRRHLLYPVELRDRLAGDLVRISGSVYRFPLDRKCNLIKHKEKRVVISFDTADRTEDKNCIAPCKGHRSFS